MIITKDFIILNFPKTGSTYIRTCLKALYKKSTTFNRLFHSAIVYEDLHFQKIYGNTNENYRDQHAVFSQIPKNQRKKPIISIVRNPFARVVSSYHYAWWKKNHLYDLDAIEKKYPSYPELDLLTFAKFLNDAELAPDNLLKPFAKDFGYNTRLFLIFYASNPEESAKKLLTGNYKLSDVIEPNITFLKQEQLTQDLVAFIDSNTKLDSSPINLIKSQNIGIYNTEQEWSQEFKAYIYKMDKYVFDEFYPNETLIK